MSRRNVHLTQEVETNPETENNNVIDQEIHNEYKKELNVVPCATLHGSNLKKIKSFKTMRRSYKLDNQQKIFITDVKQMLMHMDPSLNMGNVELLIEVCNCANQFFIYGQTEDREKSKLEAIHELMLPYFMNEKWLNTIMDVVQYKITKSNFLKRLYRRTKNLFF